MKIPFSPPFIDDNVIAEVTDSLKSGWITTGPKVKALEDEIQNLSNAKRVLCVNSWTTGAILMLRWLGIQPGDEVIVPAYTYCATALAVLWAGGKPVLVDSGEDLNISVDAIRKAITNYAAKAASDDDANVALQKATGHYGQWDAAVKYIDPRQE